MEPWELERLRTRGAVVELLAEFFDVQGRALCTDIQPRVGTRHRDLASAGTVLAVAGGEGKALALLGALRSGLIDVLVTDSLVTRAVLALAEEHPGPSCAARPARRRETGWTEVAAGDAKAEFLEATLRELDRVGYQKLSPRMIAQDVQQPTGAIYHAWRRPRWRAMPGACGRPARRCQEPAWRRICKASWNGCSQSSRAAFRTWRCARWPLRRNEISALIFQALEHKGSVQVQTMLLRAQERGELGAGAPLEVLADTISGAIWRRLLFSACARSTPHS